MLSSFAATTVGGGFINGTAEIVFSQGLIWTIAPFGIFLGLIIGESVIEKYDAIYCK